MIVEYAYIAKCPINYSLDHVTSELGRCQKTILDFGGVHCCWAQYYAFMIGTN